MSPRTVGVEEELLLVSSTGVSAGATVPFGEWVREAAGEPVEHELKLQQAEISSEPLTGLGDVADALLAARCAADEAARTVGARAVALGTSPLRVAPRDTPEPRYLRMAEEYGEIARAQLTCGQHVHVGVESRAEGVAVLDRIRDWLPVIRAISANSPYWQGSDTGYASFRTVQWGQWPTAGPIPVLGGEQRYDEEVTALVETGAALDLGMIYFDARLSARFATVEIRVADVSTEISTSVLVACLCRALVETAAREAAAGAAPLGTGVGVLRAASWRAARHGLLEHLVLPGSSRPVPAWEAVERLVEHVRAVLSAEERAVVAEALTALRTAGTGSEGQRRVAAAHGLPEMVLEAAERTIGHEPSG